MQILAGKTTYHVSLRDMVQQDGSTGRKRKLRRLENQPTEWSLPLGPEKIQDIIRSRSHQASTRFPDPKCHKFATLQVVNARAVQRAPLWHKYEAAARELKGKHMRFSITCNFIDLPQALLYVSTRWRWGRSNVRPAGRDFVCAFILGLVVLWWQLAILAQGFQAWSFRRSSLIGSTHTHTHTNRAETKSASRWKACARSHTI